MVENSKKSKGANARKGIRRLEIDCIENVEELLIHKVKRA